MSAEAMLAVPPPDVPPPGIEPEQLGAPNASLFSGVSESTWWRLHAAGKVPRPNKLGGRTLWQINGPNGLREWIRQGCPCRAEFEARQAAQRHGRG
jgi:hypothetical protein